MRLLSLFSLAGILTSGGVDAQRVPRLPNFSEAEEQPPDNYRGEGGFGGYGGVGYEGKDGAHYLGVYYGRDHRVPLRMHKYPWQTIGKIISDAGACTGGLVGRDLVLTNAHCVLDEKTGKLLSKISFYPNLINNKSLFTSDAHTVWYGKPGSDQDWAVIRLKSPLGVVFGWLGVEPASIEDVTSEPWRGKMILAGYSGDYYNGKTAGVHIGCSITGDSGKLSWGWFHTCDMNQGASGAPIFTYFDDSPLIVALNWGDSPTLRSNVAVPSSAFVGRLHAVKNSSDGKPSYTYLQVCQTASSKDMKLALAYGAEGSWYSQGWYTITGGGCREIAVAKKYSGRVYLHAEVGNQTFGNGPFLCVNSTSFKQRDADKICPNGKFVQFNKFEVQHGRWNGYRFWGRRTP